MWLLLALPVMGNWPATQACALPGNGTGNPLVLRPMPNPLSYSSQAEHFLFPFLSQQSSPGQQPQCCVKQLSLRSRRTHVKFSHCVRFVWVLRCSACLSGFLISLRRLALFSLTLIPALWYFKGYLKILYTFWELLSGLFCYVHGNRSSFSI